MRLSRRSEPFDSDDFIYELKIDGFRALAHVQEDRGELISRNGNTFHALPSLPIGSLSTSRLKARFSMC
jgi:ATP-dependent DNA ligase